MSPDGRRVTYLDPADLPYNPAWEIPRDHVSLGKGSFRLLVLQPKPKIFVIFVKLKEEYPVDLFIFINHFINLN